MATTAYVTVNESSIPRLHASKPSVHHAECRLKYLNEGGANFVFRILPHEGELPLIARRRLLRIRKDLPDAQSTKAAKQAFEANFRPLFPAEHLVQQELVELEGDLLNVLQESLANTKRPSHRQQDALATVEPHGLLITDMTPGPDEVLLQAKPKWLSQSPSAPSDARRCRTCALRAQRGAKGIRTATDKQATCPLMLVSDKLQHRKQAAESITQDDVLQEYLSKDALSLLQTLRRHQSHRDPKGVLAASHEDEILDLCKAMTLRDCTLFLRRSGDHVEARIADLDTKGLEKIETWKRGEQSLVDGGWYGHDRDIDEDVCLLAA